MVDSLCNRIFVGFLCVFASTCLQPGKTRGSDSSPHPLQVGILKQKQGTVVIKQKEGTVVVRYSGTKQSEPVSLALPIHLGDTIETEAYGKAFFHWYGPGGSKDCPAASQFDCNVFLAKGSRLRVASLDKEVPGPASLCFVDRGIVRFEEKSPRIKDVCSRVIVAPAARIEALPSESALDLIVKVVQQPTDGVTVTVIKGKVKVKSLPEGLGREKVLGSMEAVTLAKGTELVNVPVRKVHRRSLGELRSLTTISRRLPRRPVSDFTGPLMGVPGSSGPKRYAASEARTKCPRFPWPPPRASVVKEVPRKLLEIDQGRTLLRDVDSQISEALKSAGYFNNRYYRVPHGFALVAKMEQIESDGSPKPGRERWALEFSPVDFSLFAYIQALFRGRPGYYRIIVFVVTTQEMGQQAYELTQRWAEAWLKGGKYKLPRAIGDLDFSDPRYSCTALIYEFERVDEVSRPKLCCPGKLSALTHLKKAGIWTALQARSQ
jgi:hypothetical protein